MIDAIHEVSVVIVEWEEMPVPGFLQSKSDIKYAPKEILSAYLMRSPRCSIEWEEMPVHGFLQSKSDMMTVDVSVGLGFRGDCRVGADASA